MRAALPVAPSGRKLGVGELYWVSEAMSRLALDASSDIPAWTAVEAMPADAGLIYFAGTQPPVVADFVPQRLWPTNAFGIRTAPVLGLVAVSWYVADGYVLLDLYASMAEAAEVTGTGGPAIPAGTLVPVGAHGFPAEMVIESYDGEYGGVGALLGATWLLMQQQRAADLEVQTVVQKRGKSRTFSQVTVVDVHAPEHVETAADGSGRVYTHRWPVRGHWRFKDDPERNPVWIPDHIEGPAGAPLIIRDHVNVWRH